jgi:hypothetical protein
VWGHIIEPGIGVFGGPLGADESLAIHAVEAYGGTYRPGHPRQMRTPPHSVLPEWNVPYWEPATPDTWVAPFDRNLPRLHRFSDLPSLPDPDLGPQASLPHHQQALDRQARERAKQVSLDGFRIVYDEATGQHRVQILWCESCSPEEDEWGDFCSSLSQTFTEMVPVIRGIAMACSYIPVLGTGAAFLINTTVNLAQGEDIDEAFLDGVGAALPGQPASGMAFQAARSILNGERVDKAAIQAGLAALPVDPAVRDAVGTAVEIAIRVAKGDSVSNIALSEFRDQLPESAQKAMDIARMMCNGENFGGLLSAEAMAAARDAAAQGEAAVNAYVAQAGFEKALELVEPALRDGIKAGIVAGVIEDKNRQFIGTFGSVPEQNVAANQSYLQQGQALVDAGAKYNGRLVSDILKGGRFSIVVDVFDALNGVWGKRALTYKDTGPWGSNERPMTDAWRRGFLVALGACHGSSQAGPGQTAVYQTMAEAGGRDGFDAGQAVAWWLTRHDIANLVHDPLERSHSGAVNAALAAFGETTDSPTRRRRSRPR